MLTYTFNNSSKGSFFVQGASNYLIANKLKVKNNRLAANVMNALGAHISAPDSRMPLLTRIPNYIPPTSTK